MNLHTEPPQPEATQAHMQVTVGKIFIPTLVFSAIFLIALVIWILTISSNPDLSIANQALAIKSIQLIAALVLGFICVCLGFVMSWFGITGEFTVKAGASGGKLEIQATHIGLVLLIGGMLFMAVGLNSTFNYEERQAFTVYPELVSPASEDSNGE